MGNPHSPRSKSVKGMEMRERGEVEVWKPVLKSENCSNRNSDSACLPQHVEEKGRVWFEAECLPAVLTVVIQIEELSNFTPTASPLPTPQAF